MRIKGSGETLMTIPKPVSVWSHWGVPIKVPSGVCAVAHVSRSGELWGSGSGASGCQRLPEGEIPPTEGLDLSTYYSLSLWRREGERERERDNLCVSERQRESGRRTECEKNVNEKKGDIYSSTEIELKRESETERRRKRELWRTERERERERKWVRTVHCKNELRGRWNATWRKTARPLSAPLSLAPWLC